MMKSDTVVDNPYGPTNLIGPRNLMLNVLYKLDNPTYEMIQPFSDLFLVHRIKLKNAELITPTRLLAMGPYMGGGSSLVNAKLQRHVTFTKWSCDSSSPMRTPPIYRPIANKRVGLFRS